jgi:myo-inositol-1(or 4)-monophosphatase
LNGRVIKCSQQTDLKKSQIITEFGSGRVSADIDVKCANMRTLIDKVHSLRCLGSAALNSCYVANGCVDLYYEYGIHIWDIAAAVLIAKEAGCFIFDPVTGSETLNLLDRRVMISASRELALKVIPLINHVIYESD